MARKKSEKTKPARAAIRYVAITRRGILALAGILIVPWVILAAAWLRPAHTPGVVADVRETAPGLPGRAGKWGKLSLTPIVISPPMELMFTDWGFQPRPAWFFPEASAGRAIGMLRAAGVPASEAEPLRSRVRSEPRISGVVIQPDPEWVRSLAPGVRSNVYQMLSRTWLNRDQSLAFRYRGSNLEEWLGADRVSPRTRQLVEPLVYSDGEYMLFSDVALVQSEVGSEEELRRLGKALCRQPTVLARLSVGDAADVDRLIEYWGRGGRHTMVRPLLESIAEGGPGRFADVANLLPPFARNRIYRYPNVRSGDPGKQPLPNCLWSSLNFFRENPDDRYLDDAIALKALREDYAVVESDFELGDVVTFLDEGGNLFHAAVYIADDFVFTKNGASRMTPWTLQSIDDVRGFYRWRSADPRLVFHRRKGL